MMILQVRPAVESVVEDIKSGGQPADVIRCVNVNDDICKPCNNPLLICNLRSVVEDLKVKVRPSVDIVIGDLQDQVKPAVEAVVDDLKENVSIQIYSKEKFLHRSFFQLRSWFSSFNTEGFF